MIAKELLKIASELKQNTAELIIKKSPTADSRYCDFSKVTKDVLKDSTEKHITDVENAMGFFADKIKQQASRHDFTKLDTIDDFHETFTNGFQDRYWLDFHKLTERHHLDELKSVQEDVNLIDVLEYIADCVCAGMARAGSVYPLHLDSNLLEKAFQNTVELLKSQIKLED